MSFSQVVIPAILVGLSFASLCLLVIPSIIQHFGQKNKQGRIVLPSGEEETGLPNGAFEGQDYQNDPFDQLDEKERKTIWNDGMPVNPKRFWEKAQLHISILSLLSLLLPTIQLVLLFLRPKANPDSTDYIPSFLFFISFLYLSIITLLDFLTVRKPPIPGAYDKEGSIPAQLEREREKKHWIFVLHEFTLVFCLTLGIAVERLTEPALEIARATIAVFTLRENVPISNLVQPLRSLPTGDSRLTGVVKALDYLLFGATLVALVLVSTAPKCPERYFPRESSSGTSQNERSSDSQDERTDEFIENGNEEAKPEGPTSGNVSNEVSATLLGLAFFNAASPVLSRVAAKNWLDFEDLPVLSSGNRATANFGRAWRRIGKRKLEFAALDEMMEKGKTEPPSGWKVFKALISANAWGWSVVVSVSILSCFAYYLPPFFIQLLLTYIESDPTRENRQSGYLRAIGLFLGTWLGFVAISMVWFVAFSVVAGRMRGQLSTAIYAKTLRRRELTIPEENKGSSQGNKGFYDFSSKAQVMTLMTVDVTTVAELPGHAHNLIGGPTESCIGIGLLYNIMGSSALWGLLAIIVFIPVTHVLGKLSLGVEGGLMKTRDSRTSTMNEVLEAIRMIKFMAWEGRIEDRVQKKRADELKWQLKRYIVRIMVVAFYSIMPIAITLIAFVHYVYFRGIALTPSVAFTAITVLQELRASIDAIPRSFTRALGCVVSLKRVEAYLSLPEIDPPEQPEGDEIGFKSASVTWGQLNNSSVSNIPASSRPTSGGSLQSFVLRLEDVVFPRGQLSLVCGRFGSGKSLLLLSLLGETEILTGKVQCPRSLHDSVWNFEGSIIPDDDWVVSDSVAYVPQGAWLQNASIKKNILFGLPMNRKRYDATLEACSLLPDLEIIDNGDEADVGERGITLSGGQKARVMLARAVYSRASILLLDDCLSAVDSHTSKYIFDKCLLGPLLKDRTIILVSHHVQLVAPKASYVVALDNGSTLYSGDSTGFLSSGLIDDLVSKDPTFKEDEETETQEDKIKADLIDEGKDNSKASPADPSTTTTTVDKKPSKPLMKEEVRSRGRIPLKIWYYYLSSEGGILFWTILSTLFVIFALTPVAENGWLKIWSGTSKDDLENGHGSLWYLKIYAAITLIAVGIKVVRNTIVYAGGLRASKTLHAGLLHQILASTIRFHDTTSKGRVLNRFGADMEIMDRIPESFVETCEAGLGLIVTFANLMIFGGYIVTVLSIVIGILFWFTARSYATAARDLRRISSTATSPLYALYSETIAGVTVVRAFGGSVNSMRQMFGHLDTYMTAFWHGSVVQRWLGIRFSLLSSLAYLIIGCVVVSDSKFSASTSGFLLSFAASTFRGVTRIIIQWVALEQALVAVERIEEYSNGEGVAKAEEEEEEEKKKKKKDGEGEGNGNGNGNGKVSVPLDWPDQGKVQVQDLTVKYAPDLPNVLHHISFETQPRQKIGVVGLTGSGKSTLALSFFRFVEAYEGSIVIDGIDISKIRLKDLRSRLTIIPQNPTILSGTLRTTLDVFEEYEDYEIFSALSRVHLISKKDRDQSLSQSQTPTTGNQNEEEGLVIVEEGEGQRQSSSSSSSKISDSNLGNGIVAAGDQQSGSRETETGRKGQEENTNPFKSLESKVAENGENFSQGERQLICMARAILRRSKIVIMDEATASVDYHTDSLITRTIREEFEDSTIITIAHRLRTIIDFDRVLLLDAGKVIEYESPAKLLSDPESRFYGMCKASGEEEFNTLRRMAMDASASRNSNK